MDAEKTLRGLASGAHADCVVHLERIPARAAQTKEIALRDEIIPRLKRQGIDSLWTHQAEGLEHVRAEHNVAIATGTASGKSLVYQLAIIEQILEEPRATALCLFPTKALAQDQLRHLRGFALPAVKAAVYDGDTPTSERQWVRKSANVVVSNPDMLHLGILPQHQRWAPFIRSLRIVVVDEMHTLRGVFGSHVGNILRRLRRIAAHYGADPLFITASATIGDPAGHAERLTALPFEAVTDDASPHGDRLFALWNPPLLDDQHEEGRARHSANAQTAALLAGLVRDDVSTIAFARSRKGAELIATHTRDILADERSDLAARVASYRAGYLPEERRQIEQDLVAGTIKGLAATTALELGIDIGGLDACVLSGYPGTVAATWQQAGRAGRAQGEALAILVAQDDPLDQYLITHPDEVFGKPHETAVTDHANPAIFDGHIGCAAYELPLRDTDEQFFGPTFPDARARLLEAGKIRLRANAYPWSGRTSPAQDVDIRTAGGTVRIVEQDTGRLLGTAEQGRAPHALHPGAIYIHQGEPFAVTALDLDASVAFVEPTDATWYTQARAITDIRITATHETSSQGALDLALGTVAVTSRVVGYVRRRLYTNEVIDETLLDMPEQTLGTTAVWYTVTDAVFEDARIEKAAIPGAVHAAEHTAIGLMPLFAMCDRWDIGGVSTPLHQDTGLATVFIYDGYPGGAGFARRSFEAGAAHLRATVERLRTCSCVSGCPSCVQSPKCGNGNEPLDKDAARRMLDVILGGGPAPA